MNLVVIGSIVGGLIVLGIIIFVIIANTSSTSGTSGTSGTSSTSGTTPLTDTPHVDPVTEPAPTGYVSMPPAAVWDASPGGKACVTGFNTLVGGYCVLPENLAQVACDADNECTGYLRPTNDLYPVRGLPQGSVQLARGEPIANASWPGTVFHKKPKN
jgi:hypothetical protein